MPDGLLFADVAAKSRANRFAQDWKRYRLGLAAVESKRWLRPLDRRSERQGEVTAPSTQMLRYLRRIDDLTAGALRWGMLTNGAVWRLYYQGARSVSEQFFEVDLPALLDLPGHNEGLFALDEAERRHALKLFALVFRREAFMPDAADARTFHQRAIEEGRYCEERVADNLSKLVFDQVFPDLARAVAAERPEAPLEEVREATLVLLYRLLFIFYAEDRDLLPVRDTRYDDYALRDRLRSDIGRRKDQGDVFSETAARYGRKLQEEARLKEEIEGLLERAGAVDAAEDERCGEEMRGDELPAELQRREKRLAAIEAAKARLEAAQRAADDGRGRRPGQGRNPKGGAGRTSAPMVSPSPRRRATSPTPRAGS